MTCRIRSMTESKFGGLRGSVETKGTVLALELVEVRLGRHHRKRRSVPPFLQARQRPCRPTASTKCYLTGQSDRNYFSAKLYQFGGLLTNDTPQTESSTHPIIDYNYVFADPVLGGELKWNTNVLSFTQNDVATINPISGQTANSNINRIVTELNWRRRFTDAIGISYTPFADVRGDLYQFDNFTNPESVVVDPMTGTVASSSFVGSDTLARGIVDGGATVSYPWVANTASASHIVEPIGQIVAHQESIPQRQFPDKDAQSLVFDDTNLFKTSKFSGYDRIETGTTRQCWRAVHIPTA